MIDALDRARAAMHAVPSPQSCSLQGLPSGSQSQQHGTGTGARAGLGAAATERKTLPVKADTFSTDTRYPVCEHCKFMGDAKQVNKNRQHDEEGAAAAAAAGAAAGAIVELSSSSSGGGSSASTSIPAAAAVAPLKVGLGSSSNDLGGMRAELPVSGEDSYECCQETNTDRHK